MPDVPKVDRHSTRQLTLLVSFESCYYVTCSLEPPALTGQLAAWHLASGNDILGTQGSLWEEGGTPLPSHCFPPLPTSGPEALPGDGGGGRGERDVMLLQQVAKGPQRQRAWEGAGSLSGNHCLSRNKRAL